MRFEFIDLKSIGELASKRDGALDFATTGQKQIAGVQPCKSPIRLPYSGPNEVQ